MRNALICRLALLVPLLATLGGCKKTLVLQRYPDFYEPSMKTVAVATFSNATLRPEAGEFVAERVAEALRANGTYEVTGPEALKARLAEKKISLPAVPDTKAIVEAVRKLGDVQAVLTGTVKGFSADRDTYTEIDDWYGPGWGYYGWGYGWGHHGYWGYYRSYPIVRQYSYGVAYVSVLAALTRVSDGKTLHATHAPLAARLRSPGSATSDEVLVDTVDAVARAVVSEFAVAPVKIKVSKGKALRTARPGRGGKLDFDNDFKAGDEEMYVVVALPPEADRNTFRVVITREDREQPLAEEQFTWSAKDRERRLTFSPKKLVEAGGQGDFEVKLYADQDLLLDEGFEIED